MKSFTPLLAITLLGLAIARCVPAQQDSAASNAVETKLKAMEDAWVEALVSKDSAGIGDTVADDNLSQIQLLLCHCEVQTRESRQGGKKTEQES